MLTLPPPNRRSPPKFQPAHWLRLNWYVRTKRPGAKSRHWNQLLMVFSSARRRKPRSLLSKPGRLVAELVLKRMCSPPILLKPTAPAWPLSVVASGSDST